MFPQYTTEELALFYIKIDKSAGEDACWIWTAAKQNGYGVYTIRGKTYKAHRLSWMLQHQEDIPEGLFACHKCDNRACVNPSHIFLGTPLENIQDCYRKGRKPPTIGEKHGRAKLTEKDAIEILELCRQGEMSHSQIAHIYGVTAKNVQRISSRKTWHHLG